MKQVNKIIKYIAIALAILLTVNIISMIMYGIVSIGSIFIPSNNNVTKELKKLNINQNSTFLDIDISSSNIIIKEGIEFKIETNNKYIKTKEKSNKLFITEDTNSLINNANNSDLIIYIPSNYIFDNIYIENGAGEIEIEKLNTKKLNLDLGAGKVNINDLTVNNAAEIDGGAGEIKITNSNINNLDIDMGIGALKLTAIITGDSEIDAGVGTIDINLVGTKEDYKIILDKGIGTINLDGEKMKDKTYYGEGPNIIDLSGGIGNIKINFINN